MKPSTRDRLKASMLSGKYYTRKEVLKMLNPTQSSIAEYLFNDVIACGYLQEGASLTYRINQ